ncbi:copper-binding protein [Asticcacaulis taihuensis]|jgi:Cu(I)/Ag(I) efflux system protein CusF|uniref:copper-binding protein n=1 Tax=Asticcacaulis taihuensis TaxID=260084 RepID=UPI0026EB9D39|nr:copper-binding protein [Asticcacaulis taihuensis]
MKKMIIAVAACSLSILAIAPAAFAHAGHEHAVAQTAEGEGVIKAIDAKGASITIAHGPIAALKWPAMTMTFKTEKPELTSGLTVGQSVHFVLKNQDGKPVISEIHGK